MRLPTTCGQQKKKGGNSEKVGKPKIIKILEFDVPREKCGSRPNADGRVADGRRVQRDGVLADAGSSKPP